MNPNKLILLLILITSLFSCKRNDDETIIPKGESVDLYLIPSISPIKGEAGSEIIISGKNFNSIPENNSVTFIKEDLTSFLAAVTSASSQSLTVRVPEEILPGTYDIRLEANRHIVNIATKYTVKPSVTISSFYPLMGEKGSTVNIVGTNFSPIKNENTVYLISGSDTLKPEILSATPSIINVEIPENIRVGNYIVKIKVNGKLGSAKNTFKAIPTIVPSVTGFSSAALFSGALLAINGVNISSGSKPSEVTFFNNNTSVKGKVFIASGNYLTVMVPVLADGEYSLKIDKYDVSNIPTSKITIGPPPFTFTSYSAGSSPTKIVLNGIGFATAKTTDNVVQFLYRYTSYSANVGTASATKLEIDIPHLSNNEFNIAVTIAGKTLVLPNLYKKN